MTPPQSPRRRVAITGLGIISPIGKTPEEFWANLLAGKTGIAPATDWDPAAYPVYFAAKVADFDPLAYMERQQARRMARFTQFGLAAAREAVKNARLDPSQVDPDRVGVSLGSAVAGMGLVESESVVLHAKGPLHVNPMLVPSVIGNMAACLVAIELGLHGPVMSPVAACATGSVAIGDALERVARGEWDVALAGGTDSVTTLLAVTSFGRLGALSRRNGDPWLACRPFDVERDGTVLSEGAAVLVLESEEHARERGADILAEAASFGQSADAYHVAAPDPNGAGAAKAMSLALHNAGLQPGDVSCIIAHGTGTPLNDISESRAIGQVFGELSDVVPLTSNKYAIGHTLGAAGAISAVAAVQAIRAGVIPGTLNLRQRDPECRVNTVAESIAADVQSVLVNAFGFGGQNASLVVRRWA